MTLEKQRVKRSKKEIPRIQVNLGRKMGERGILNVSFLAGEINVSRHTLTLLVQGKAKRIDLEVLLRLCLYFECTPGDLLEIVGTWN